MGFGGLISGMEGRWAGLRIPAVPSHLQDSFVMAQYARIIGHVPLMYAAIGISTFGSCIAAPFTWPPYLQFGLPAVLMLLCLIRAWIWLRRPAQAPSAAMAEDFLRRAFAATIWVCLPCTLFTLGSFHLTPEPVRPYVPVFLVVASLCASNCLSSLPRTSLVPLILCVMPSCAVLFVDGTRTSVGLGLMFGMIALFQAQLVLSRFREMLDNHALQTELRSLSRTDSLTGLLNRRALYAEIGQELQAGRPSLILLDLDGFKPVNDRHGHAAGDELLRQVAERIRTSAGQEAIVGRLGGDEFVVVSPARSLIPVEVIAQSVLAALSAPYRLSQVRVALGASLGIATAEAETASPEDLMEQADRALYRAKSAQHDAERLTSPRLGAAA